MSDEDVLILQPTRVVQRKGIEHAIELVHELGDPKYKLIISHAAGDEASNTCSGSRITPPITMWTCASSPTT